MAARNGGGQESAALMNYLARVKDECKPAIYSAFISLMNAYHGNMLNVDAFLDELYVLFSPRVYLLADVKPLVDESYHQRIDELCDKVRSGAGGGGGGDGGAGTLGDNYSLPATLNAFSSLPESNITGASGSNNNHSRGPVSSGSDAAGGVKAEARSNTPLRGGSGAGNSAEAHSTVAGASPSTRNGPSSPPMPLEALGGSTGVGVGVGGGHSVASAAASMRSGKRNEETEGILSMSSPSTRVLSSDQADATDIAELLSGIEEPSVDSALLDFMMCDNDNTPPLGASAPALEPPPLSIQQPQQQQQQQQSWSFSTPSSSATEPAIGNGNSTAAGGTSPPKKRSASADSTSSTPSSAERIAAALPNTSTGAGAGASATTSSGSTASMLWSRRESAPNLADLSCRIHATPNAGCRNCRGGSTAAPRRRCTVAISSGTSKQQSAGRAPVQTGIGRCSSLTLNAAAGKNPSGLTVGLSGGGGGGGGSGGGGSGGESHNNTHHGNTMSNKNNNGSSSSSSSSAGSSSAGGGGGVPSTNVNSNHSNNNTATTSNNNNDAVMDVDDATFHGPGKRVWEKTASGGGGGGLSTPVSCSTPPTSFYFPSAAAAAAASSASVASAGSNAAATPSRPNARRRISTDSIPTCINDEYSSIVSGTGANGRRESISTSLGGSGGRFGGNIGGGGGGGGSGAGSVGGGGSGGGGRRNSPPLVNLDPDSIGAKSSGFAGMGSARSLSIKDEGSRGGGSSRALESGLRARSSDDLEKMVVSVATRGMQQALQYGLRNTFFMLLRKKDDEIAELKEEALRWSANDTRLRQINQQLHNDNNQLRAAAGAAGTGGAGGSSGWDAHSRGPSPKTS